MLRDDDALHVARAYGLGGGARLTGIMERGEQGQIRQLETDAGLWAVKMAFELAADALDGEDAAFQTAAAAAGVPAPAVVRTTDGEIFTDVGGGLVRVYAWVDLLPPHRAVDPEEVGRIVALLHRCGFAGRRPEDPWYTDPVGSAGWDGLIADLAAAGAPFATDMESMRDDLVAMEALLEPAADLCTCHRDLWADNLRPTAGNGLCLIDWENCGLADPGQELSGVLFEFWDGDADRATALYRQYRRSGGPGSVDHRGSFSMTIAQLGHIVEISCRAWLNPTVDEDERRRQAGRVAEAVSIPLTPAIIDELLDALGSS